MTGPGLPDRTVIFGGPKVAFPPAVHSPQEAPVRKLMVFGAVAALFTLGACKDAGENQVEIERPTVGTTTDTITTPDIDMPDSVVVPTVDVGRDTVPTRP